MTMSNVMKRTVDEHLERGADGSEAVCRCTDVEA